MQTRKTSKFIKPSEPTAEDRRYLLGELQALLPQLTHGFDQMTMPQRAAVSLLYGRGRAAIEKHREART